MVIQTDGLMRVRCPPVGGGASGIRARHARGHGGDPARERRVESFAVFSLSEAPLDDKAVRRAVEDPAAGAVVVFHGTVRNQTADRRVTHLEYEAYPAMALAEIARIAKGVATAHGLLGIACAHRIGRLEIGDTAVVLAVSSPHRKAALDAIDDFIVRLKRDVPIWKKEHFEGGAVWIGTPGDPQGVLAASVVR